MSSKTKPKPPVSDKSDIPVQEADLLWDEYKYRHDLIWRHLIRSTAAVIALIAIAFSNRFSGSQILFIIAALLAVSYTIISIYVLHTELPLFESIKAQHRERQHDLYDLHSEAEVPSHEELVGRFSRDAYLFLGGLLLLALVALGYYICGDVLTIIPDTQ